MDKPTVLPNSLPSLSARIFGAIYDECGIGYQMAEKARDAVLRVLDAGPPTDAEIMEAGMKRGTNGAYLCGFDEGAKWMRKVAQQSKGVVGDGPPCFGIELETEEIDPKFAAAIRRSQYGQGETEQAKDLPGAVEHPIDDGRDWLETMKQIDKQADVRDSASIKAVAMAVAWLIEHAELKQARRG